MKGKILRFVDRVIGFCLYSTLSLFSQQATNTEKNPKSFLVIKLWAIGETVLVLPALAELKKLYPRARIVALCTSYNKSIFEQCDAVDEVLVFSPRMFLTLRKHSFDTVIDFEPYTYFSAVLAFLSGAKERIGFSNRRKLYTIAVDPKPVHAVQNFTSLVHKLGPIELPKKLVPLRIPLPALQRATMLLSPYQKTKKPVIGVHVGMGSSSAIRRWSDENFASLCDTLIERYKATIIFMGSNRERTSNARVMHLMRNHAQTSYESLSVAAALMSRLDLFIGTDSGPMHLAAAMGAPTIGLFGPNTPAFYGPYGKPNIGIYKGPQEPLIKPFQGIFPETLTPEYDPNRIKVSDVLTAAELLLKHGHIRPS